MDNQAKSFKIGKREDKVIANEEKNKFQNRATECKKNKKQALEEIRMLRIARKHFICWSFFNLKLDIFSIK